MSGEKLSDKRDQQKQKRPPRKISQSYLQNSGLYYLQRFAASEVHFRKVMQRKIDRSLLAHTDQNHSEIASWLDNVVSSFIQAGYLNDARYAKGVLTSMRARGKSTSQIKQKLKSVGVEADIIDSVYQDAGDALLLDLPDDSIPDGWPHDVGRLVECCAALRLAKKRRLGPFSQLASTEKPYDKQLAILARAGFGYDVAKIVLDTNSDEANLVLLRI